MSVAKGIDVTCPYCGHKERMIQDREGLQLVLCSPEEGGCDREFAIDFIFTIETKVYTLKPVRDDEDAHCWYCKGLRPIDDDLPCPACDKPGNPLGQPKTGYNYQEPDNWLTENLPKTQAPKVERPGAEYGAEA